MIEVKPWHEFELLLAGIHKTLAPDATVTHNIRVNGRRSGRPRQIDILITQSIGLQKVHIAIECKRHARPLAIDKIDAFVTKLEDVGASVGVIVSAGGFDDGAIAAAKSHRISLLSYRDATNLDWDEITKAGAWFRLLAIGHTIDHIDVIEPDAARTTIRHDTVVTDPLSPPETALSLAKQIADDALQHSAPGIYTLEAVAAPNVFVTHEGRRITAATFVVTCILQMFEYYLNLSLATGHVLSDPMTGQFQYRQLTSRPWDMHQVLCGPPDRELDAQAFAELVTQKTQHIRFDPAKTKRFMRLVLTQRRDPH